METNTPMPEVAQRKSLEQRIAEETKLELHHRKLLEEANKNMEPFKKKMEEVRAIWSLHYNKLKYLQEIASEEEKEIAQ